jgi:hypothetical protein
MTISKLFAQTPDRLLDGGAVVDSSVLAVQERRDAA